MGAGFVPLPALLPLAFHRKSNNPPAFVREGGQIPDSTPIRQRRLSHPWTFLSRVRLFFAPFETKKTPCCHSSFLSFAYLPRNVKKVGPWDVSGNTACYIYGMTLMRLYPARQEILP
jgi:hypothetical protein